MKKNKEILVKFRREKSCWLAYFIEFRKIIPVNFITAKFLDFFFNKNLSIENINKSLNLSKTEISSFLKELKKELEFPFEGGHPIIEEEFLKTPLSVELQIITRCNLRCKHCAQKDYTKIMELEKIKKILKILHKKGFLSLILQEENHFCTLIC